MKRTLVGVIGRKWAGAWLSKRTLSPEVDVSKWGTLEQSASGVSGGYICGSRNMTGMAH